ncbi:serine hydrolase domain-containing protein [Rariglobus hedericola]|uniref:Beta-lactamase family protein n=1 Tax=Rariglobus hedericola TaxID=2597822 RepID=A0A556QKL4_9BACT|nr:serine hydrolase domain-containing protein [Rariglobus hedericola]TSJ77195.1 beta-lactamase family protein [Rariglobus hedericola]
MKRPDLQAEVQQLFDDLVAANEERGLQAAVYLRGELVVDAFAGLADSARGTRVTSDTLFPIFSCGKGVTATLIHRLVERGVLAYDLPIASVWPEFAVNGKAGVTLKQVLNHTAGLHLLEPTRDRSKACDWAAMCSEMAAMKPAWEPGSRREYHAITQGWILGEAACRATGRTFEQLLEEEIRAPLGLKNMFIGISAAVEPRVAVLEEVGPAQEFPEVDIPQSIPNWVQPLYAWMNRSDVRQACIPASNGIMTAHDLARHYAALCPSGVDGVELLPAGRVAKAIEEVDPLIPTTMGPCGLGYGLGGVGSVMGDRPVCFGHGGHGGTVGFADLDHGLAVGFARNRLRDPSGVNTARLLMECVRRHLTE